MSIVERFVQNAAFLLAIALIFDLRARWTPGATRRRDEVVLGFLVGATAALIMLYGVRLEPGLVLDTRGVVFAISGLFFGPVPTLVALATAGLFRVVAIGGPATLIGVVFMALTGLAGLAFREGRGRNQDRLAWGDFATLGLLVGVLQISLGWRLVNVLSEDVVRSVLPSLLLFNTVGTVVLGLVLQARRRRMQLAQSLAERENSFRTLTEQIPAIVYRAALDDASSTLYISPAIRNLGYTVEDWTSDPEAWVKQVHPDDLDRILAVFAADRASGEATEVTYRLRHRDGTWRTVIDAAQIVRDAHGIPLYLQGTLTDITEQQRLLSSSALQAAALDAAADAITISDAEGRIEWVNRAFTSHTGYSMEEAVGRNPRDFERSGTHDPDFFREMWHTLLSGNVWSGELVNRRKDGTLHSEEQTITPVRGADGKISHFIAIKRDITARRDLEMQYRQAQKMEGIGLLAGGVAHDLNNLLTVINGTVELLLPRIGATREEVTDLLEIRRAADRAASLTRHLLAFSRQQVLRIEVLDLNHVVSNMMKMLTRVIGEDVRIETCLAPELCTIRADSAQLDQVLLNLTLNARDAMPSGGTLRIETSLVMLDAQFAAQHVTVEPGRHVMLTVTDTGVGMDAATRARIFEPFFTTKEAGKGTGLGLSTVYGIVKQSGGSIWVSSEPGKGTTFTLYFPAVEGEIVERVSGPSRVLAPTGGSETILVVEDEDAIRQVAIRVLAMQGYTVLQAESGEAALEVLAAHGKPIDLLLTDMVMPGMTGPELAGKLREIQPRVRVLFTSGYSADAVARQFGLTDAWAFISKPYGLAELTREVRRVLDE